MKRDIEVALKEVCLEIFKVNVSSDLSRPDEQFGDYATNLPLKLANALHRPPIEIANQLANQLSVTLKDQVGAVSVVAPGFLNFKLTDRFLLNSLKKSDNNLAFKNQKVVIEINNPNPFKDIHIGHAFNAILADTIANLLEAGGAETHRVSYHGDVGLHVGKAMWAIMKFVNGDLNQVLKLDPADRPKFLSQKYTEGAVAYEEDDSAKPMIEAYAKESFRLTDQLYKQVYETCKDWSFQYFDEVFRLIGCHKVERRYLESQADKAGQKIVEAHIGDIFERSAGAVIFPGEKYGLHTRVFISSRGTTLYEARDLGLMKLKQQDFQPQASYIVTAVEQQEYFKVVLKAADLSLPTLIGVTHNLATGTVKLTSGKMSSRQGTAINISWLLDTLRKALKDRGAHDDNLDDELVGALRYTMLKNRLGSDVVFNVNDAISLDGNSGPYIQYAHARARSILKKVGSSQAGINLDLDPAERSLARKISEYPEVVDRAINELRPHHICNYLFELAQSFNRFYETNRVVGSDRESSRSILVQAYADVISKGLQLLSIPAPLEM